MDVPAEFVDMMTDNFPENQFFVNSYQQFPPENPKMRIDVSEVYDPVNQTLGRAMSFSLQIDDGLGNNGDFEKFMEIERRIHISQKEKSTDVFQFSAKPSDSFLLESFDDIFEYCKAPVTDDQNTSSSSSSSSSSSNSTADSSSTVEKSNIVVSSEAKRDTDNNISCRRVSLARQVSFAPDDQVWNLPMSSNFLGDFDLLDGLVEHSLMFTGNAQDVTNARDASDRYLPLSAFTFNNFSWLSSSFHGDTAELNDDTKPVPLSLGGRDTHADSIGDSLSLPSLKRQKTLTGCEEDDDDWVTDTIYSANGFAREE